MSHLVRHYRCKSEEREEPLAARLLSLKKYWMPWKWIVVRGVQIRSVCMCCSWQLSHYVVVVVYDDDDSEFRRSSGVFRPERKGEGGAV